MCYVLSFALQLSGGVILLLLWVFTDARKKVIDTYHPSDAVAMPDDNDMCTLKREKVQEIAADIYRNRFAFGDLCSGTLIAIVAEKTLSDCENVFWVFVAAGIITGIEYYIAGFLAGMNFREDMQIPSSQLSNVTKTASDREMKEMLAEIGFEVK